MSKLSPVDLTPAIFNVLVQTSSGPMLANRNDCYVGRSLIAYGECCEGESAMFRQLITAGDTVIEAGANIGMHTLLYSQLVGESGRVFAFEPQRIVFQTLCANLAINQCLNVFAREQGLGRTSGEMVLPSVDPRVPNNFGGLNLLAEGPGERVDIVTIDGLNLPRCNFIKADVEGMEGEVLAGAAATIRRCRPLLYLENDRTDRSAALIEQVLSLGYRLWWHLVPLFNPNNFAKNPENIFGGTLAINMLCQPAELARPVSGLREILNPLGWWNDLE